ncbi:MAG: SDR family oxidoreductase [Micromonosporaceae bacterium]
MTRVLVTGATGTTGRHVVAALRERGASVRAFVRDAARAVEVLGGDVECAVGDFEDMASLRRAMQGVDHLFLSSADGPRKVAHEAAVIDAAAATWVQRTVKLSTIGAGVGSPVGFCDWHGQIEEHLRRSGLPAAVLRSSFYMTNLYASAEAVAGAGKLFAPAGDAKIAMIESRDVAAAAVLLTEDGHEGRTYEVTGPDAITYQEVAEQLSAATGRTVEFVDLPGDAAYAAMLDSGAPQWLAENLVALFGMLRDGGGSEVTDTVRALTGHSPRGFAEFARDHAAAFGGR